MVFIYTLAALLICLGGSVCKAEWTVADTSLEVAYTVLHVIDWGQTLDLSRNSESAVNERKAAGVLVTKEGYHEHNPVLGRNPHPDTVNAYFAGTLVGHAVISYLLPPPWREIWQGVTVSIEGMTVTKNFQVGMRVRF